MKIIFLDIDGVLNDHTTFENGYGGIQQDKVRLFNDILAAVPDAKIVISSAWRYQMILGDITLKGFEYMLLGHGINCKDRLWGHTGKDDYDSIPPWTGTLGEWSARGLQCRSQQIRDYVFFSEIDQFVVLDDLELDIDNFVKTDGKIGLTDTHVKQVIEILNKCYQ